MTPCKEKRPTEAGLFSLVDLAVQLANHESQLRALTAQDGARRSTASPRQLQVQRRLTSDETAALVDAYRRGDSVLDVSSAFGIHRTTVLGILEGAGIERRGNKPKLTGARLDRVILLYEDGHSCATIAEELKVHPETIRRALMKAGIPIRPRRGA
jgi:hypothetical protein